MFSQYYIRLIVASLLLAFAGQSYAFDKKAHHSSAEQNSHHTKHENKAPCKSMNPCRERKPRFKEGFILPQHYRGNGYKVDYRQVNLNRPNSNQQWYKINDDYILLDTQENRILQIKD